MSAARTVYDDARDSGTRTTRLSRQSGIAVCCACGFPAHGHHRSARPGTPARSQLSRARSRCATPLRAASRAPDSLPGDRVGILSLNRVEFVATLLGACAPASCRCRSTSSSPLIPSPSYSRTPARKSCSRNRRCASCCPAGLRIVVYGEAADDAMTVSSIPGPFTAFEPAPDSIAVQPYTSGSTGRPKGVLLTHYGQNWSRRILAWSRAHHTRTT